MYALFLIFLYLNRKLVLLLGITRFLQYLTFWGSPYGVWGERSSALTCSKSTWSENFICFKGCSLDFAWLGFWLVVNHLGVLHLSTARVRGMRLYAQNFSQQSQIRMAYQTVATLV